MDVIESQMQRYKYIEQIEESFKEQKWTRILLPNYKHKVVKN